MTTYCMETWCPGRIIFFPNNNVSFVNSIHVYLLWLLCHGHLLNDMKARFVLTVWYIDQTVDDLIRWAVTCLKSSTGLCILCRQQISKKKETKKPHNDHYRCQSQSTVEEDHSPADPVQSLRCVCFESLRFGPIPRSCKETKQQNSWICHIFLRYCENEAKDCGPRSPLILFLKFLLIKKKSEELNLLIQFYLTSTAALLRASWPAVWLVWLWSPQESCLNPQRSHPPPAWSVHTSTLRPEVQKC